MFLLNLSKELFAKRLQELRIARGLSQDELAKILGVSRGAVGYWEFCSRQLNLNKVNELSKILNCSPAFLLGLSIENDEELLVIKDIFYNSDIPMHISSLINGQTKLLSVNDAFLRMLGYNRAEFLELSPRKLFDMRLLPKVPEISKKLNERNEVVTGWILTAKNGELVPCKLKIKKLQSSNKIYYFSAVDATYSYSLVSTVGSSMNREGVSRKEVAN